LLDEERVAMRQRRLTAQPEQVRGLERDPSSLLRGAALQQALAYEDLDE
jgi:hypothetical protein